MPAPLCTGWIMRRSHRRVETGCLVHHIPAIQPDGVGCSEPRVLPAERLDELFRGPECPAAPRWMRAVAPGDQISREHCSVAQRCLNRIVVLFQTLDAGA